MKIVLLPVADRDIDFSALYIVDHAVFHTKHCGNNHKTGVKFIFRRDKIRNITIILALLIRRSLVRVQQGEPYLYNTLDAACKKLHLK